MTERWYEFVQVETFRRPYYVHAATLAEARAKVRAGDYAGDVSDYAQNAPDDFRIIGSGRLADSEHVESLIAEPDRLYSPVERGTW